MRGTPHGTEVESLCSAPCLVCLPFRLHPCLTLPPSPPGPSCPPRSNTSAKFYGEITQQMLKNSSFPGSNNGTGLFQTIVGLKVRPWGCAVSTRRRAAAGLTGLLAAQRCLGWYCGSPRPAFHLQLIALAPRSTPRLPLTLPSFARFSPLPGARGVRAHH